MYVTCIMNGAPQPARPWHPVVAPGGRFHWLLGARVALAFVGPFAVAHVTGRWQHTAPVVALAGLLVALVVGSLPAGPTRRCYGPAVVAAAPAAALVYAVVAPNGVVAAAVIVLAALAAGMALLRSPAAGAVAGAFTLSLIVLGHAPAGAHTALLLLAGGAMTLGLVVATDHLRHPRLGLPELPAPVAAIVEPDERLRHALRLPVTVAVAATVALLVGQGSTFTAHSWWMLLGAWIALQPHASITQKVALQRGAGTLAGALLTAVVAAVWPSTVWIGWVFLVLAFVAFGLRTVNYAWYCVLLTPMIVIGFSQLPLDGQLLLARATWTVGGVLLAVIARHLLWNAVSDPAPSAAPVAALA